MRKQTKLVAVLSAAALLAIGASMTSFAATGWVEENGTWVYYDKDGYTVTDTWKKSGNNWFYLNEDGEMAISELVEDEDNTYYVDETGKMVVNQWVEAENDNYYDSADSDDEPETVYYYFQSTGKAYKGGAETSFKTINGKKYAFDQDGKMLFGWVNDASSRVTGDEAYQTATYYCGEANDGARVSNAWANLYVSDAGPDTAELEDQEYVWFWFQTNGKKFVADAEADVKTGGIKTKKINGKTYGFDENGIMRSDWQSASSKSVATDPNYNYFGNLEDGSRRTGWFQAVPSDWVNPGDNADEASKWFYGDSKGKLTVNQIKTINGKKYIFNEKGEMMTGLIAVNFKGDSLTEIEATAGYNKIGDADEIDTAANFNKATKGYDAVYYFSSTSDDGSLKTGTQNVTVDGDTYQFSFKKDGSAKGQGINSSGDDKVLYILGKKIKADTDNKYQVVDRKTGIVESMTVGGAPVSNTTHCIINTSGSIMKGSSFYKDADGNYYHIKEGQIEYTDSNKNK